MAENVDVPARAHDQSINWLNVFPIENEEDQKFLDEFASGIGDFPSTKDIVLSIDQAITTKEAAGVKLTPDQLTLLQKVFDFITEGTALGLDEAINFQNRVITDKEQKLRAIEVSEGGENAEPWSFYSGDYRGSFVSVSDEEQRASAGKIGAAGSGRDQSEESYIPHEHTGDSVHFMKNRIESLLKTKSTGPVVMVDIGGMYGATLLELAQQFSKEIKDGKLVLIVTNLTLTKEIIESKPKPKNGTGMTRNYEELYAQNKDLVHFLRTDLGGLSGHTIHLPNGKEFTLTPASVDILHESWSVSTNSKILEQDAVTMATLIGDTGIILSQRRDPYKSTSALSLRGTLNSSYLPHGSFTLGTFSQAYHKEWDDVKKLDDFTTKSASRERLRATTQNLENRGLREITDVYERKTGKKRDLNYVIWSGKKTPPLEIVDYSGKPCVVSESDVKSFVSIIQKWLRPARAS